MSDRTLSYVLLGFAITWVCGLSVAILGLFRFLDVPGFVMAFTVGFCISSSPGVFVAVKDLMSHGLENDR